MNIKLKQNPTQTIKMHRRISKSMLHMMTYSQKMRIKRVKKRKAPRGYGIVSKLNKITQKRLLSPQKYKYIIRFFPYYE